MKKKIALGLLLILVVLGVATCKSPQRLEAALQEQATPCLRGESSLNKALACLEQTDLHDFYKDRAQATWMDCGPFWGYPFYASCAGLAIRHDGDAIREFNFWHRLDGPWWPRNET